MKNFVAVVLLSLFVVGCGKTPTLDTSSKEAYASSLKAMSDKLDDDGKKKLAGAVMLYSMGDMFAAGMSGKKLEPHVAAKELHGLNAEQIIAKGQERAAKK